MSRQSLEHKRHHRFGRHRSGSYLSKRSPSPSSTTATQLFNAQPRIFEGTDAVPQHRKVTLQRVIDTHHALELKHGDQAQTPTSTSSDRPTTTTTSSSSSIYNDPFPTDISDTSSPNAEVRAFRYLLRRWDSSTCPPDPDFDHAVTQRSTPFEETALKHFFARVALWDASEEEQEDSMTRSVFFFRNRRGRTRERAGSDGGFVEKGRDGDEGFDALKGVTTREGLAQLLWTILHGDDGVVMRRLRGECLVALKEMYRMTVTGVEGL